MRFPKMALAVAVAGGLALLPSGPARAQYWGCDAAFPLSWPVCTAAWIVTAPFRALAWRPYYPYPYPYYAYYRLPYYPPYYPPPYYGPR